MAGARGANQLPDAVRPSLILRRAPASWLPLIQLARLDRPIGWQLLLAPCWQSSALASLALGQRPNMAHLLTFLIGAVAMRGAGSTYNDWIDRDIDAKVERTAGRPLPSGRISPTAALVFAGAQGLVGLLALLTFNPFAIGLGFASLAIVAIYPFAKRFTSWPQAVLGLAFAWGGLMGWAAIAGALAAPAFWLYGSAIAWTIGYDTIYALQDRRDDPAAGVRSTARLFGENTREAVAILYALACAAAGAALWSAGAGTLSFLGLAAFAGHCAWQVSAIRLDDPGRALSLFRANRDAGLLLFGGIALDALAKSLGG